IAGAVGALIVAIIITILAPAMWFFALGGGLLFAVMLLRNASNFDEFVKENREASAHWQRSLEAWKTRTGVKELVERRYSMDDPRKSYQGLAGERRTRIEKH